MSPQVDVWSLLDLVDQILRHGAGQRLAANQHHYLVGVSREVQRRLPSRVRSTYDIYDFTFAGESFGCAAAVVHTGALQLINAFRLQTPPLHASRNHQRMTRKLASIPELHDSVWALYAHAHSFLRQNLHAESLSLHNRAPRQITSAQPARKAQIILDSRAHSGLSTGRLALNQDGGQSFRRAIDRGGQSCGTSAKYREIVEVGLRARSQANLLGNFGGCSLQQPRSVRKQDHGQTSGFFSQGLQQLLDLRIAGGDLDIDPLIRNMITRKKIAQLVRGRRPARAQHANSLEYRTIRTLPVIQQIVDLRE